MGQKITKKQRDEARLNKKRLAQHAELVKNRIPKHPHWGKIMGVIGYVDSHGAVHAKIRLEGEPILYHESCFPNALCYKTWRWTKSLGFEKSAMCTVDLNSEDGDAVRNWLYNHGCLQDWEI